jgi:hypothetical protein
VFFKGGVEKEKKNASAFFSPKQVLFLTFFLRSRQKIVLFPLNFSPSELEWHTNTCINNVCVITHLGGREGERVGWKCASGRRMKFSIFVHPLLKFFLAEASRAGEISSSHGH